MIDPHLPDDGACSASDDEVVEAYRLFHDLPFIGMAVTSPNTKRWRQVNQTLCDLLGYPRDVLIEMSWAELTHPDDLARDVAAFERVIRGETDGYRLDKRFIRADGQTIYASIDVKAVRSAAGAVRFFVATVADVSARVEVYPQPGIGASFKICPPRVSDPVSLPALQPRAVLPRGTETIVVVEDDTAVRELIVKLLERQGYRVFAYGNGPDALAWVRGFADTVHLLLTDVIMPGMNGKELAESVTTLRPGIRVLYASGYTANVIVHHGVLTPGVEFIAKPFAASALATRVRDLLDVA